MAAAEPGSRFTTISQPDPSERKVRNGSAATSEYRADGESNAEVRSNTTPARPHNASTSDSGVCVVAVSWIKGRNMVFIHSYTNVARI
jgi:hypothetical protein